eukprot:189945-Amphidinium_carterae.1
MISKEQSVSEAMPTDDESPTNWDRMTPRDSAFVGGNSATSCHCGPACLRTRTVHALKSRRAAISLRMGSTHMRTRFLHGKDSVTLSTQ